MSRPAQCLRKSNDVPLRPRGGGAGRPYGRSWLSQLSQLTKVGGLASWASRRQATTLSQRGQRTELRGPWLYGHRPMSWRLSCHLGFWMAVFLSQLLLGPVSLVPAQSPIETKYGRSRGAGYSQSLNGTSLLKNYLEWRNYRVINEKMITPRIDDVEIIIWFPDRWEAPGERVIERLDRWLSTGENRTLVYVGRDYDAANDYWQHLLDSSTGRERELILRESLRAAYQRERVAIYAPQDCDWFATKLLPQSQSGPVRVFAKGKNGNSLGEVVWSRIQLVPQSNAGKFETLLRTANGDPFAFALTTPRGNRLIVVNNGSCLVNFGFALPQRRAVAEALLRELPTGFGAFQVMLLESGPEDPPVRESTAVEQSLPWIAEPPLKYIVPQLVLLGVLYCFVIFPILGRPRLLGGEPTSRFGRHLEAIGRLWSQTGEIAEAKKSIERYKRTIDDQSV